jgi:phospholipid-binding lipoprotein MlaA
LNAIDVSADNLSTRKIAEEAALDRYSFLKDAYLQKRQYLITDGGVPDDFEVLIDME